MPEFDIKVENVVVFATLGKDISPDLISTELEGAEYAPESFPGVVYRIKEPRAATLIFSSGKIVCTGAKSIENAKKAVDTVVEDMRKIGVDVPQKFDIRVENIVASTQIETLGSLSLEEISFSLENSEYEPESFPGLVFRLKEPRVAFLLFRTGKVICTGARDKRDIQLALGKFKKRLEEEAGIKFKASK